MAHLQCHVDNLYTSVYLTSPLPGLPILISVPIRHFLPQPLLAAVPTAADPVFSLVPYDSLIGISMAKKNAKVLGFAELPPVNISWHFPKPNSSLVV